MAGELEQPPSKKGVSSRIESLLRVVNPFERKKKEEKEFQEALRVTIAKLLEDIKKGGFVYKPSDEYGDEEFYVVKDFTLGAGETQFLAGFRRSFHFSANSLDPAIPFFSPEWEGAYLLLIERQSETRGEPAVLLKRKENLEFLRELFSAEVDIETTNSVFAQAKKENPDQEFSWVRRNSKLLLHLLSPYTLVETQIPC